MFITKKGSVWEIKKTIPIILLGFIPIFNSFAFFSMNKKIKQKKWKVMGWVFLLLQISVIFIFFFVSSVMGPTDRYQSSPKLEDYLGVNYYAKYGSDYKTRPEYERYLKDVEEWEETLESGEQEAQAPESVNIKEKIISLITLFFYALYTVIFVIICIQREKYLKLLSDKEDEEEKDEQLNEIEKDDFAEITNTSQKGDLLFNEKNETSSNQNQELPMNWFQFVIYIQLFVNMVLNLVNAGNLIGGIIYIKQGTEATTVYSMYPKLVVTDKLCGVMYLALVVLAIFVRQGLAKYKKYGPNLYLLFIIAQAVVQGIYNLTQYLIVQSGDFSAAISQIFICIIMIVANKIYFDRRKKLFIN